MTHHDLRRLSAGLGRPAASLIEWLGPDAVEMTGEPGSFVELREGRRLMVLGHRGGACQLLDDGQRCSGYALRPLDCRLYPFDLHRDEAGAVVGVSRLDPDGCGDEAGQMADLGDLAASDERRWRELADYRRRIEGWNRLARHRRRFRHRLGGVAEFLAFLGV